jgi:hypothetical protein
MGPERSREARKRIINIEFTISALWLESKDTCKCNDSGFSRVSIKTRTKYEDQNSDKLTQQKRKKVKLSVPGP